MCNTFYAVNKSMHRFIPDYPDVPTTEDLTERLEFNRLYTDVDEDRELAKIISPGTYFRHQVAIIQFITIYPRLFLFHRPGTGKTCAFIGAAEKIKSEYKLGKSKIRRTVILTNLESNIESQILCDCTNNEYTDRKSIKDFYQIMGYKTFSNEIAKYSNERSLIENFDNTFYIIDEVHKIKSADRSALKGIEKLFDRLKNSKILVSTATPMPDDIRNLTVPMNLLLPLNKKLVPEDFDNPDQLYSKLKDKIGNSVSFIRELDTGAKMVYKMSGPQHNLRNPVWSLSLTDRQRQLIENIDTDDLTNEKQVENTAGNKNVKLEFYSGSGPGSIPGTGIEPDDLTLENIANYSPKCENILQILNEVDFSGKHKNAFAYSELVEGVINVLALFLSRNGFERYDPTDTDILKDTDLSICGKRINSNINKNLKKKRRYGLYTGDINLGNGKVILSDKKLDLTKELFNHPKNSHGEYIQIMLLSPKGGEGISLANIQDIFILNGNWNFSKTYQGLSRGIRTTSHVQLFKELIESGREPKLDVNVYQMCMVYDIFDQSGVIETFPDIESMDVRRYKTSEDKDLNTRKVERYLKQLAFDCNLNKARNVPQNGTPGSQECDYQECDYVCEYQVSSKTEFNNSKSVYGPYDTYDPVTGEIISNLESILTNPKNSYFISTTREFDLLWGRDLKDFIGYYITVTLRNKGLISISWLLENFINVDPRNIFDSIGDLIYDENAITDQYGFKNYPVVKGDFITLYDTPNIPSNRVNTLFYIKNKTMSKIDPLKIKNVESVGDLEDNLAMRIDGQLDLVERETIDDYLVSKRSYWYSVDQAKFQDAVNRVLLKNRKGKKSDRGVLFETIMRDNLPRIKQWDFKKQTIGDTEPINFKTDLVFTNILLENIEIVDDVKTHYVSQFRNSLGGTKTSPDEVKEIVKYFDSSSQKWIGYETEVSFGIRGYVKLLRALITKHNNFKLENFMVNHSINVNNEYYFGTLYPDNILRLTYGYYSLGGVQIKEKERSPMKEHSDNLKDPQKSYKIDSGLNIDSLNLATDLAKVYLNFFNIESRDKLEAKKLIRQGLNNAGMIYEFNTD